MSRTDLRRMALLALEEACLDAKDGPLPKSRWLRMVLRFLHLHAHDANQNWINQFWTCATYDGEGSHVPHGRTASMNAALNAIYRQMQIERTPDMMNAVAIERKKRAEKS